jgi:RNA polymerase sigma-70 factor (ECF subfamily)
MGALHHKALSLTQRPAEAADLVQDTYLRAYRSFSSFTEGTNCKAWLFTIQYSIFVNRYRKAQREPEMVSLDELGGVFDRTLADPEWDRAVGDLSNASVDWSGPEVAQALANLPESFRTAVMLVDVDEFSYEEAAGILNCPVGTLRSRLSRARAMLFLALREYARKTGFLPRTRE